MLFSFLFLVVRSLLMLLCTEMHGNRNGEGRTFFLCYLLCLITGIRQRQKQIHRDSWVQYLKARVVHTSMDREYGFRAHTFCHCVFCSDSDVNYSDYKNNC